MSKTIFSAKSAWDTVNRNNLHPEKEITVRLDSNDKEILTSELLSQYDPGIHIKTFKHTHTDTQTHPYLLSFFLIAPWK